MGQVRYIQYDERMPKIHSGGIKTEQSQPNQAFIYPTFQEKSPVQIVEFYMSKIPSNSQIFYNRINGKRVDRCYNNQPLESSVTAFRDAGHSESEVKQISGHRSDTALR